jgi:histone demethylase JARID1
MTSTDSADFREKVVALWSRETTPTLQELRTLLAEGEQEKDPENEQELKYMRTYIQQLAQWTQEAKLFLQRPVSQGNSLQKPVDKLLVRACEVGADKDNNPLFVELSKYKDQIQSFDDKVKEALASSNLAHQKKIYQLGRELKSGSEDFQLLAEMVMGREWELQVEETLKKPFNVRHIRRLIKRGKELGLNGVLPDHLAQIEQSGKKWTSRIDHICKGKLKVNLSDEHELLTAGKNNENPNLNITIDPDVMAKLEELIRKSKETLKEMDDIFECKRPSLLDRPSITDAQRLLTAGKDCIFESDQVKVLQHEVSRVSFWHDQARSLFVCGKLPLDTIAKETLANVQSITLNQDKVELWCLCRRPEAGLMVECDVCHEWYHNSCIKMPAHVEEESSSVAYICPVCSGENDKVQHFTNKPKLEDMMDVLEKAETLLFCPKEFGTLDAIQQIMLDYKNKVQAFCRSRTQLTVQDVPMIRKHLRHLEGLEIALPDETDFLKDKLASLAPLPSFAQVGHHKSVESRLDHVPSLAPLVFHNENSSSMCTCGRLALENANAIECLECHHKFHIGCIGPLQNDAYHCPRCTRDIGKCSLKLRKRIKMT